MSNSLPFNFDGQAVRIVVDDAEPWFHAGDVCAALGYANPRDAVSAHVDGDDVAKRDAIDALGRTQQANHVNESGLYALVFGSKLESAKRFKRWVTHEVLPAIRKTGSFTARQSRPTTLSRNQVAASILLLRSAAEDLKFAPSAVLGGYQRLESQLGVTGLLPGYAVDSANSASGSSDETKAAGELLEKFGVGLSAIAFNRLLLQHGILEERERPSSKGGTKKFKVCVNLAYGKNLTSPNNPRETQPHWYVSKFQALLDLVLPAKPTVAA